MHSIYLTYNIPLLHGIVWIINNTKNSHLKVMCKFIIKPAKLEYMRYSDIVSSWHIISLTKNFVVREKKMTTFFSSMWCGWRSNQKIRYDRKEWQFCWWASIYVWKKIMIKNSFLSIIRTYTTCVKLLMML